MNAKTQQNMFNLMSVGSYNELKAEGLIECNDGWISLTGKGEKELETFKEWLIERKENKEGGLNETEWN